VNISQPHHAVILGSRRDDEMSDVQRSTRYLNAVDPQVRSGTVPVAALGR